MQAGFRPQRVGDNDEEEIENADGQTECEANGSFEAMKTERKNVC